MSTTKEPCPKCGSSDNLRRYDDGHAHCFSIGCDYHEGTSGSVVDRKETKRLNLIEGLQFNAIPSRKLTQESCEKWGYGIGEFKGQTVQVAVYRNKEGKPIAQKVRFAGKDFLMLGDPKQAGLYGQHLWKPTKKVTITEGEIDAISVSQAQDHKWPVVSVPNGSKGAKGAIESSLEWLEQFEEVIFMFDMDEPGRAAAVECALLLSPGKAFIADLPLKDASDMLKAGRTSELRDAIWKAKAYRPDGVIDGSDITAASLTEQAKPGLSLPYKKLQERLHGIRKPELILLTAGTGIGKSTLAREMVYHLAKVHGKKIGNIFLEENIIKTAQGYIAIDNDIPLGRLRENPKALTVEAIEKTLRSLIHGRMHFYKHFGSMASDTLLSKIRFMIVGLGCEFVVLDHLSLVISGMESSGEGERKDIDILMTRLRSLVEETGATVLAIVHLKQPDGKAHEEGAEVSLNQLRGSGSLKQLPDTIIAMERDQQSSDPYIARLRLLKNREWGDTGPAGYVRYYPDTGRLLHTDEDPRETEGFVDETKEPENKDF